MNKPDMDIEALEQRLRRVSPAKPSDALMARLQAARPVVRRTWRMSHAWPLATAATLCMAVGLAMYHRLTTRAQPAVVSSLKPLESADYLLGGRELGLYNAPNGQVYRIVQCVGIHRQAWKNESTSITCNTPEQRLLLIPMDVD